MCIMEEEDWDNIKEVRNGNFSHDYASLGLEFWIAAQSFFSDSNEL